MVTTGSARSRSTDLGGEAGEAVGLHHVVGPQPRGRCSRPTDARADAPKVAVRPTSASPITSADAVIAVRRGLRMAFARASDPGRTEADASGAPRARTAGRATAGSSSTTPSEHAERAERDHLHLVEEPADVSGTREPVDEQRRPPATSTTSPIAIPTAERADCPWRHVGDGRHRRHPRRPHRREDGGDHGDHDADEQARPRPCGRARTVEVAGRSSPSSRSRSRSPTPSTIPDHQPEHRRHRADHERLEHDRPHHLPAGRTHGSQQPELAGALGHQDREGVEDDEGADHHADGREPEQRVGEEAEELAHRLADLERRLRRGLARRSPGRARPRCAPAARRW